MRLKINGIEREVQIVPAPRGTFYLDDSYYVIFPIFIAISNTDYREYSCFNEITMYDIDSYRALEIPSKKEA